MTSLLHDAERDRLLLLLRQRLLRDAAVDGRAHRALAATAASRGPLPVGANAAALELFCQPAIWPAEAALGRGVLDFLLAVNNGPVPPRRWVPPRLEVRDDDPRRFLVVSGTARFTGDLSRGVVIESLHPPEGDREGHDPDAARHTGNLVEFRLGRVRHCLDVEDTVTGYGLRRTAEGVVLHHESRLVAPGGGWLRRGKVRPVVRVLYEYLIRADSPVLRLSVTVQAEPGVTLRDLRITTAWDEMSEGGAFARAVGLRDGAPAADWLLPEGAARDAAPPTRRMLSGPLDHLALVQNGPPARALALHARIHAPERLLSVTGTRRDDRLHWVLTRYRLDRLSGGESVTLREDRLLVAGGRHDDPAAYAALLRAPELWPGRDFSAAEDEGAALSAVAAALLFAADGSLAGAPSPAALRAWVERQLDGLFHATGGGVASLERASSRFLAFLALALDAASRATGAPQHAARLAEVVERILRRQDPEEGSFATPGEAAGFAGHAASLLALARAALHGVPDTRLPEAVTRGLLAIRPGRAEGGRAEGPEAEAAESLTVRSRGPDGRWQADGAQATEKLGLLLRALAAVRLAAEDGALPLPDAALDQADALTEAALELLRAVLRDRGPAGLEILSRPGAENTDLATQARVMLGLLQPDAEIAARRPAATEAPELVSGLAR
ncbi:hypothetical protein [Roseomonas sp. BN140053]|uniref:hypothetical protein n=1 Tax=Roseomonas sp. BN140053 TaxID=3391898 RepID=UPI0039E8C8E7